MNKLSKYFFTCLLFFLGTKTGITSSVSDSQEIDLPRPLNSSLLSPEQRHHAEQILTKQQQVSAQFFDFSKRRFLPLSVHLKLIDFQSCYTARLFSEQKSPLPDLEMDLTGLSSRSRVYLLSSIGTFKTLSLSPFHPETFKDLIFETETWKKTFSPRAECIDKHPVSFKIGPYRYQLQLAATMHQRGGGRLFGLYAPDKADTYKYIYKTTIQKLSPCEVCLFSQHLKTQKKDGLPIDTGNRNIDRFLNGFNLLLDFEMARRLHKDDFLKHDLPVIFYLEPLLNNLKEYFPFFMLGHQPKEILSASPVKKTQEAAHALTPSGLLKPLKSSRSLFTGGREDRLNHAHKVINRLNLPLQSAKELRATLAYLHGEEETSDDEYENGDGEGKEGKPLKKEEDYALSRLEGEEDERFLERPLPAYSSSFQPQLAAMSPEEELNSFIEALKKKKKLVEIVRIFQPGSSNSNGTRKLESIKNSPLHKKEGYMRIMRDYKQTHGWTE